MYCNNCGNQYPMKWYKFVIYVQLFLSIISALVVGVQMITGLQYGGAADDVYALFGSAIRTADIMFGILYLALIPFAIIVRQKLVHYKEEGPRLLLIFYGTQMLVSLVYALLITIISGINAFDSSTSVQIFGTVWLIVFSRAYFKKREALFCN